MHPRRPALAVTAAVAVALLAGCGQEDATEDDAGSGGGTTVEPTETTSTPGPGPTDPVPPESGPAPTTGAPEPVVDQAIALLADQLDVPEEEIEVSRAVEITWRDGSIGCAEKDKVYTQALVDGALVELTAGGTVYAFHQGAEAAPFYCANPTEPLADQ